MIYTVTLNPSIDFIVRLDHLELGSVNRMTSDDKFAGGKGINVSRILQRLDVDNTATGFIGGFTGRFVEDGLTAEGIKTNFVQVSEDTRINVKIKAGEETEINGAGPKISDEKLEELKAILAGLSSEDTVVFAGSAPSSLGNQVYNTLIPIAKKAGAEVVCDFEGQTLLDSLNKRINFLNLVVKELGLTNVTTIHSRAEDGARNPELREKFDVATSRAVANMAVLSEFCMPYVKKNGHFVALKGPAIEEELENGKAAIKILGGELKNIIEVSIEGTDLRHNIVEVLKVKECNKKYPRKAGTVNKNPLK